ncbi:MAG: WG repeat-containing protein [Lewinellaceae bacterium]|nr:WG repeat-containing protein [Lewinellaceae bacterium]
MRTFLIGVFLPLASLISAQTLIPYLGSGGYYDYATESGEIVVRLAYDQLAIMPEHEIGAVGALNRRPLIYLRNGMTLSGADGRAVRVVNFETENSAPDTLRHLWMVEVGGKLYFVNHLTGETRDYWPGQLFETPFWFPWHTRDSMAEVGQFRYGVHRVYRKSDRVNFIDTTLKEIFPRDFAAAAAISPNYFLLGDGIRQLGVGDHNGQIRIPLMWENIETTPREGYFLVNNPVHSYISRLTGRAGMLDADGKIVLDTIFQNVRYAGNDYLVVETKTRFGLADYSGKWVFPPEFEWMYHVHTDCFVTKRPGEKVRLLNSKGENLLGKGYDRIGLHKANLGTGTPYLILHDGPVSAIADSTFRILFSEKLLDISGISERPGTNIPQFITRKAAPNRPAGVLGLRDETGQVVIPEQYDQVGLLTEAGAEFFVVQKGALWGVFDRAGNAILPVDFSSIRAEADTAVGKTVVFWAKPAGLSLFYAFDRTGQKLPGTRRDFETDPPKPAVNAAGPQPPHRKIIREFDRDGTERTAILDAGGKTVFAFPDSLEAHPMYFDSETEWAGDFLIVCRREDGLCGLLDSMGNPVLPFRFRNLAMVQPGRLLSCDNANKTDLLDWQGQVLFAAPRYANFTAYEGPDGYWLASAVDLTVVVSPENTFVRPIPGAFQRFATGKEPRHLALFFP